ncbi:uncharacterized protein BT62DRAFT_915630 [Guyanagaster necrorhizus]|uniref:Uncharacterized protein n=1 Tax=Guyanagaster necrorhizus TaxID=856835 RepID=A0A9P8AZB9_9AGAR|nr:uncharacterized protein BT62DRAFT_915630 [Guyanagaster necrorhizus MCA 3950]KAG7451807.1 hypothetical protein BT62DRAFT_915630 [Guyanagaster necrorhizus MCA 3950]
MVTQINIPSDLTDANKAFMSQGFNADLNSIILCSLLNGIYTGIVAVTLWNICYFDFLAAIARGIAPTLLVGHVAAGHTHPDNSWQESTASSSLHFGIHSGDHDSQQDSIMNGDLEAQQMIDDEYGHHIAVESQEDIGINSSEGIIHRDYNGLDVLEIQV